MNAHSGVKVLISGVMASRITRWVFVVAAAALGGYAIVQRWAYIDQRWPGWGC